MSLEAIKSIKECEERAKEIISSADDEARSIVREAKIEGQDLLIYLEKKAKVEAERMINENEIKLAADKEKFSAELKHKTDELYNSADKNIDKAVDFIVDSVIKAEDK